MYFWDKHKTITSYYELLSSRICDQYGLTQMEYDILMFLHNNPQHNTAAEIVKIRKSTKSHVSTSLKKLENKGFIERIQSEDNKKHIEIVLLDKAELIVEAGNVWRSVRLRYQKQRIWGMDIWFAVIFTIKDTGNGSMLCVREDSGMQLASWPWHILMLCIWDQEAEDGKKTKRRAAGLYSS